MKNLVIFHCLLPFLLMGQNQQLKFKHLTSEDGLSQSFITCIFKDSRGFMWFGTEDGLNRYDGSDFTVFRHIPNDDQSLSSSYITAIVEQEDGFLWVGTRNGLNYFDPDIGAFKHYTNDSFDADGNGSNHISALHFGNDEQLLIGTTDGLYALDSHHKFSMHRPENIEGAYHVVSLKEDNQGYLWVLSTKMLEKISLGNTSFTSLSHRTRSSKSVNASMWVDSLNIWVGTSDGLVRYDLNSPTSKIFRFYEVSGPRDKKNGITSIAKGSTAKLWLGSNGGGLIAFNTITGAWQTVVEDPYSSQSLKSNYINSIFADEDDILWLGTTLNGINKYDPNQIQFEHYKHRPDDENSLSESTVRAFLLDKDGELWVGTHDGLNRINLDTKSSTVYRYEQNNPSTISSNTVRALAEDSRGTIWAGTWEHGFNSFDKKTGAFKRYIRIPGEKDSLGAIRALAIDQNDHIWSGGSGLWKLNPKNNTTQSFFRKGKNNVDDHYTIGSLYFDPSNLLWIGTYNNGLNSFNPDTNKTKQYLHDPKDSLSISHNHVTCTVKDNNGLLWVGTYGGGLNILDPSKGTFKRYNSSNGLLNDVIYGILIDDENFVWFTSNAGLCRFDPTTEDFKYFGVEYGIQSKEFNAGAYHKSREGEFFFGGINGFNAFYPSTINRSTNSKKIVFTEFQLLDEKEGVKNHECLDKAISRAENVKLNATQNNLSLKFAELNYSDNTDNRYEYQLFGSGVSWQYLGKNKVITLANLRPGNYRLDVRVQNNLTKKRSINITVMPPIWRTNWAYVIYLMAIVSFSTLIYRNVKKFERTKREFESKIANLESNNGIPKHKSGTKNTTNSKVSVQEVPTTSMNQKFVERAIQIVEENISDSSFGVEKFMDEMFMSRSQLHRKLKTSTGYSTTKFIRYIRLQRAAQLLKGNTATVAEIAYKVGFENVGYFSKCFNETFGIPPSQYSK